MAVVPRPEELWGLLNTPAEDDASTSATVSDQPPEVGDDSKDLFKSI